MELINGWIEYIKIANRTETITINFFPAKIIDINKLAYKIREIFDDKIKEYKINEPILHMENGRYITGPYGYLVSRCNVIKNSYEI